ncbi:MAG TPA: enoyl-CoA hydratase/isomerase family protein, partial [Steroidobacteraceae bacterium]|nr:enoyl-CoA hydratase/isomerase family protein [Steroidobacteraceae bacterium]
MEILSAVRNGIATVTLNRPSALNALTQDMVLELHAFLREWADSSEVKAVLVRGAGEKAFCAGGDVRALYESFNAGGTLHNDFFVVEYELDAYIHSYPKPFISLMNGITMGGGMGVAQGAHFRVATDNTRIAMPEVGIGLIPDVGASYFLSRLPGSLGPYLALTGNQMRAADALYAGLADFYLSTEALASLDEALQQIQWTQDSGADIRKALLSLGTMQLPGAPLEAVRTAIDRHFSQDNAVGVLHSLRNETSSEYSAWTQQTLTTVS